MGGFVIFFYCVCDYLFIVIQQQQQQQQQAT